MRLVFCRELIERGVFDVRATGTVRGDLFSMRLVIFRELLWEF